MNVLFVAGAVALIGLALAFAVLPLWRKKNVISASTADMRALYLQKLNELEADLQSGSISPDEFESASNELKKSLLSEGSMIRHEVIDAAETRSSSLRILRPGALTLIIILFLPSIAICIYALIGSPNADMSVASAQKQEPISSVKHPMTDQAGDMEILVQRLERRLNNQPGDPEGWALLVRSYLFLGKAEQAQEAAHKALAHGYRIDMPNQIRSIQQVQGNPPDKTSWLELAYAHKQKREFPEAAKAFSKALENEPNNPDLLADYADALAMTQNQSLKGRPLSLVNKALAINPDHPKALWLAATAALENNDKSLARRFWERLLRILPENSQDRKIIEANIAELDGTPETTQHPIVRSRAHGQAEIHGIIRMANSLDSSKFNKNDTVFIFAKAVKGPRMPLAVIRMRLGDLPAKFVLNDSMAMRPDLKLSDFKRVRVTAKVSKSGAALTGDAYLSATIEVADITKATPVQLILEQRENS